MNILNRISTARCHLSAAMLIGTLLLSAGAGADELQDATQLFKQGQQTQALSKVNNYLANKPMDAQGRFLKGLIFTEQNKIVDAIKIFLDLTQDFPELPEPYNNLAVLYASRGQYDKAKSALEMAIRTHPSYATAHENLGDIYVKMASHAYDRALQLDSSNTTTQTKLAMIQNLFSDNPRTKSGGQRNPVTRPVVEAAKPLMAPAVTTAKAPSAAVIKPAAKTPVGPEAPMDAEQTVQDTVEGWAAAWSSKNIKKYLSYYAADFKTPDGESRASWTATRKDHISRPKHIEVKLSHIAVDFTDNTHATVKFQQNYLASNFKAAGGKTLLMVQSGSSWFILEERAN